MENTFVRGLDSSIKYILIFLSIYMLSGGQEKYQNIVLILFTIYIAITLIRAIITILFCSAGVYHNVETKHKLLKLFRKFSYIDEFKCTSILQFMNNFADCYLFMIWGFYLYSYITK